MDIKEIQELIKFVAKSGVSEVSIDRKDFKITIGSPNGKVKMLLLLPNNNKVSFLENNNISTNKECLTKR